MWQQGMGSTSRRYALSPSMRLTTVRQVKDLVGEPPQERQVHLKMQYFFFLVFPSPSAVPRSCQGVWQGLSALLSPNSEGLNYFFFLLLSSSFGCWPNSYICFGIPHTLGFFILFVKIQSLPLGRPLGLIFSTHLLWAAKELQFSYGVCFLVNLSKFFLYFCLSLFLIFFIKEIKNLIVGTWLPLYYMVGGSTGTTQDFS